MQNKVADWKKRLKGQDTLAQFIRGSSGSLVARVFSSAVALGATLVLTNLLGASEWGDYAYAVSWLTTLVLFGRFGFNKSATRYLATYISRKEWPRLRGFLHYSQRTTYKISTGIAVVVALLLVSFSDWIEHYYGDDAFYHCMLIAMLILPFLAHLEIVEGILDGYRRVMLSQIPMRIMRPALIALSALALFYLTPLGRDETGMYLAAETTMFINLCAVLAALGVAFLLLKRTMPPAAENIAPVYDKGEWYDTSRDMMLTSSFNLLLVQADVIMLGLLIDTEAAGVYTIASRVALLLILALTAVNAMLQPVAAALFAQKRHAELQRIVSLGANAVFAISLIGCMVLYFGTEPIIRLFGGDEYLAAAPLLRILIFGQLFNAFAGPAVLLLNMTGHQRDSAKIMAGGAVLNFALNAILISLIGIEGAAYASATTTVLWNMVAAAFVWYRLKLLPMALWFPRTKPAQ